MSASIQTIAVKVAPGRTVQAVRLLAARSAAEILPELGGMVRRLAADDVELLASDPDDELLANRWFRGRILFPFNDRIPGGRYSFGGRQYRLPINSPDDNCAIHGLAYASAWSVLASAASGDRASLELALDPDRYAAAGYPFAVRLVVRYELAPGRFELRCSVENVGDRPAPYALGWHPYFSLPALGGGATLTARSDSFVPVDEQLLPTGTLRSVDGTSYDFRTGQAVESRTIDIALSAPEQGRIILRGAACAIELRQDPTLFRFVQLFAPPDRRSIAIEPITAATNSFNLPALGLRILEPGERDSGSVRVGFTQTRTMGL